MAPAPMVIPAEAGLFRSAGTITIARGSVHPITTLRMSMQALKLLRKGWKNRLEDLVDSAQSCLLIATPFITQPGVEIVQSRLSNGLRERGEIRDLPASTSSVFVRGRAILSRSGRCSA